MTNDQQNPRRPLGNGPAQQPVPPAGRRPRTNPWEGTSVPAASAPVPLAGRRPLAVPGTGPAAAALTRPYAWNAETGTVTCRRCGRSGLDLVDVADAGRWHAVHRSDCTPPALVDAEVVDLMDRLSQRAHAMKDPE
ncbi:hypothetical protein ACIGZJ_36080 [Kitasatospora sp. NPDC052868]|uniref:hypothetical protein n=1 Tax=Kitasatospora sp. NPDC052868 TaxID=3364060 RepID=UPI0037CB8ABB